MIDPRGGLVPPLALLVLSACPISEKVGGNPSETSDGNQTSSGTTTGDQPSSGTTIPEATTTENAGSTTTESPGSTTMMGGGPPSECGPPCDETWTYVGDLEGGAVALVVAAFTKRPVLVTAAGIGIAALLGGLHGHLAVQSGWRLRGYHDADGVECVEIIVEAFHDTTAT